MASRALMFPTDWCHQICRQCLKHCVHPPSPNQRERGASINQTKRIQVTGRKDTLNIKKAVCCSEVTPEKENREERENVNIAQEL
ncbi:hypothetical protein CesoFtcFv8_017189 [Champsocephalus esox]|uniref:Uncharacterized protein n=1 Tax=Champsocephalus esox TaxID=159716 RepID=A0AAN8GQH4_9TELE|nr:hypothetical protein CesoFtcFv8_017189 [Champsocephalus esox]